MTPKKKTSQNGNSELPEETRAKKLARVFRRIVKRRDEDAAKTKRHGTSQNG